MRKSRMTRILAWAVAAVACLTGSAVENLRGFGCCEKNDVVREGGVTESRFRTSSASGAETVAGKFLYDLSFRAGVSFADGVWSVPGGNAYAVTVTGVQAAIYSAASRAELAAFLAKHPEIEPVETAKCPEWMKRFEWSLYGLSGLDNMHGWMAKAGAKPGETLDPREDMDFLRQMGPMAFDLWIQTPWFDDSYGIASPTEYWKLEWAEKHGIPYGARFYLPANGYNYASRRFAAHLEQPAPWMMNGWLRYSEHQPHFSWFDPEIWRYFGRASQRLMKQFDTGRVRDWMHPAGELVHQPWYDMHADYSPMAKASWARYLKAHGVTLADTGEMYARGRGAYTAWEQVEVPEFATFAGLPGMTLDLAGTWMTSTNGTDWTALRMPGNWDFLKLYGCWERGASKSVWTAKRTFRRSFDCAPTGKRTYLYFFPMNRNSNVRHTVTLNGHAHAVGQWCGIDVTDELKTVTNELSIELTGHIWNGRIFLSSDAPAVYPNLGAARNRLYQLWCDWRRDEKAARCEEVFEAMRAVDPNAPIKFMAPIRFGTPITDRLMRDWGGYAHFTGEGLWYFPWYKRYGRLWGYQGTSELAGPYQTVECAERSTLRVFLAGLDMHEPVFLTQTYARNPPVRDWWLRHKTLLRRMGRQDIYGPQVLIYRRSTAGEDNFPAPFPNAGASTRRVNTPWDWDIGRGTLQSLGQSMLYVDDDGIEAGKMYDYRLMVDCGNEVIPPERLAEIEAWVRAGGTFVAWPFTGRSTATEGDSWPFAKLAGATVAGERPLGGTVTFPQQAGVFAALSGKSYADSGRTTDCNGNNLNDCSFALKPTDAQVAATYADGAAAVTVRTLGRGRVIWFGSAFWRDAADVEGIWWPGAGETAFVDALLKGVGFDAPLVSTDDALVWAQPYRSNDGSALVGILCNFNTNGEQQVTVTLRTAARPRRLLVYGVRGLEEAAFDYKDGVATAKLSLPAREVTVVEAEAFAAAESVDHWWRENAFKWHALKQGKGIDFAKYGEGEWSNPAQNLKTGAEFSSDGGQTWKPCVIDVLQFWGLPDGAAATARKTFDLDDASWLTKGGETRLVCAAWAGPNFATKGTMSLNGVKLTERSAKHGYLSFDVTKILRRTGNELVFDFEAPADGKFTGLSGTIYLTHRAPAERSLELADGFPIRLSVPEAWRGRYRLVLNLTCERPGAKPPIGVACNGRFMRKHHHNFGTVTDIDITALVTFGAENVLEPLDAGKPRGGWQGVKARLDLFEAK